MKSIVVYDSSTGNTKKVAEEIAKGLDCQSVHIKQIRSAEVNECDLVVVGSPVHASSPTGKVKCFLNEVLTAHIFR